MINSKANDLAWLGTGKLAILTARVPNNIL
jgi:hypothetical protein